MLASWQDGQTRDLFRDMLRLTMENAAETLFGADVREHAADVAGAMQVVLEDQDALRGVYRLPSLIPTARDRRYQQAIQRLDDIIYDIIRRRRESGRDTGDLLSLLLDAQDEDGRRMTDQQLRDEAMTIFVAGHETTAICLAWTWYLLAQHPDVEARLVSELQSVLGGRAPDAADLSRLPYTERVVLESLRLYPPVWGVTRIALRDCEIGEYHVPAGASVAICQYAMHRDPRYFDDPLTFDPDRWDGDLAKRLPRYAYCPFGGGARLCIGKAFGMMEAMLVLATVAQQFRLALVPDHPVTPWPSLTLRPRHGIQVVLARRPGAPSGRGVQAFGGSGVQEAEANEGVPASPNA
jgi:cytochrome P450